MPYPVDRLSKGEKNVSVVSKPNMDIQILCEQFCDYSLVIKGHSKASIPNYKYAVNGYVRYTGINNLNDVTVTNMKEFFYTGRTERNWSVNTFISNYKSLRIFFKWCVKEGYISFNPLLEIEKPKKEYKIPTRLRKEDAFKLLELAYNYPYAEHKAEFIRARNHAIFSMFIFAGLRKKELHSLKYADVDIEGLTIFIRHGKGGKDRIIPISYTLAQSLKRYISQRKKHNKTCPEFFASSNGNVGYTQNGLHRLIKIMKHGLNVEFSAHKLRHTFATLMIEGGCDIYSLSKMMGHSDIKTTTIYLSATTEHLKGQIKKHPLNDLQYS